MSTEDNVVLDVAEAEAKAKADAKAKAEAEALAKIEAELAQQKTENKVISTQLEKQLDNEIRATINRNLIRQRQAAYIQAMQKKQQRRRRFGLKFK